MKTLLKTFLVSVLFLIVVKSQAQISLGGGLWYGSDINSIGISANGCYEFSEKLSAAPAFTYFLEKDYMKWSALDLDINYTLTKTDKLGSLYAICGLGLTFWKADFGDSFDLGDYGDYGDFGDYSDYSDYSDFSDYSIDLETSGSDLGVNLGLGLRIAASEKITIAPELKYTITNGGYFRIGTKVLFGL